MGVQEGGPTTTRAVRKCHCGNDTEVMNQISSTFLLLEVVKKTNTQNTKYQQILKWKRRRDRLQQLAIQVWYKVESGKWKVESESAEMRMFL